MSWEVKLSLCYKTRLVYRLGNCLINLEDIKDFKAAIELEIIGKDSNREIHYKKMRNILDILGIHQEDYIETSITRDYMKKYAFKQ